MLRAVTISRKEKNFLEKTEGRKRKRMRQVGQIVEIPQSAFMAVIKT